MEATMIAPKCDEDIPRKLTTLALNKNTWEILRAESSSIFFTN